MSEKFPWLFERHFGIRAYDYWHGYTAAQIDLMAIDQPITVYPKADGRKRERTKAEIDALCDEWEKEGHGTLTGRKVSLSELFGKKDKDNT